MKRIGVPILILLAILSYVVPVHLYPTNYPADDAYFYLQVARHIDAGNGSTFHTITPTNGYHPLWMLLCVSSTRIAGEQAMHVALALQQIFGIAIAIGFVALLRRLEVRTAIAALPLLALYFTTRLYASEAYISGLLLVCLLHAALGYRAARSKLWALKLGMVGGLAVLARLDNAFVVLAVFAMALLSDWKGGLGTLVSRGRVRATAITGLCSAAVFLPYIAINLATTGHPVPVSGAIKSTMPDLVWNLGAMSTLGQLCALGAIVALGIALLRRRHDARTTVLVGLGAGILIQAAQLALATQHHTGWPWYYMPGVLCLALVGTLTLDGIVGRAPEHRPWSLLLRSLTVLALIGTLAVNAYSWVRYRSSAPLIHQSFEHERMCGPVQHRWQQALGEWLSENLEADAGIVTYDWPGMFAYFSDRRVLPLDGLINDYQYNDDLTEMGIRAYLRAKRVTYWLGPLDADATPDQHWYSVQGVDGGQRIDVTAPLYRSDVGHFTVRDADLVARLSEVVEHSDTPKLGLWRIETAAD